VQKTTASILMYGHQTPSFSTTVDTAQKWFMALFVFFLSHKKGAILN